MDRRPESDPATRAFVEFRDLLFTVAYELLGSAPDAEDVLQETWLRWAEVDLARVRDERAYLVRITTRQALNRLRTLKRHREVYIGPWLPDPLLTTPDAADGVELAESVSMALMIVLETLMPTERAVFVLREIFGYRYDEIAAAVEKSPAAVRQIAHRARRHVRDRRPRRPVPPSQARAVLESFRRALDGEDPQRLLDVMAPDVVMLTDGGGVVQAARRPVRGAEKVVRYLLGLIARHAVSITAEPTSVNGSPALAIQVEGDLDGILTVGVENSRITELYYVRNPAKLRRVTAETTLTLS